MADEVMTPLTADDMQQNLRSAFITGLFDDGKGNVGSLAQEVYSYAKHGDMKEMVSNVLDKFAAAAQSYEQSTGGDKLKGHGEFSLINRENGNQAELKFEITENAVVATIDGQNLAARRIDAGAVVFGSSAQDKMDQHIVGDYNAQEINSEISNAIYSAIQDPADNSTFVRSGVNTVKLTVQELPSKTPEDQVRAAKQKLDSVIYDKILPEVVKSFSDRSALSGVAFAKESSSDILQKGLLTKLRSMSEMASWLPVADNYSVYKNFVESNKLLDFRFEYNSVVVHGTSEDEIIQALQKDYGEMLKNYEQDILDKVTNTMQKGIQKLCNDLSVLPHKINDVVRQDPELSKAFEKSFEISTKNSSAVINVPVYDKNDPLVPVDIRKAVDNTLGSNIREFKKLPLQLEIAGTGCLSTNGVEMKVPYVAEKPAVIKLISDIGKAVASVKEGIEKSGGLGKYLATPSNKIARFFNNAYKQELDVRKEFLSHVNEYRRNLAAYSNTRHLNKISEILKTVRADISSMHHMESYKQIPEKATYELFTRLQDMANKRQQNISLQLVGDGRPMDFTFHYLPAHKNKDGIDSTTLTLVTVDKNGQKNERDYASIDLEMIKETIATFSSQREQLQIFDMNAGNVVAEMKNRKNIGLRSASFDDVLAAAATVASETNASRPKQLSNSKDKDI